jgi:hypothetical protein
MQPSRIPNPPAAVVRRAARKTAVVLLGIVLASTLPLVAQTVEQWQRAAVQKHPGLAQAGSPLNQRFLVIVAEKRKSDPGFFARSDWPARAADAAADALKSEESAAKAAVESANAAKMAELPPEEREWEKDKARWVFERLVFGDNEEVIAQKLYASKIINPRVPPKSRMELGSRFQWIIGESKFRLNFEVKNGLAAIDFVAVPQKSDALDSLINEDWGKLRAATIERFGPPATSLPYPETKTLTRGGWTVTDTWERPGMKIKLGIIDDAGKCSAALRISDPARVGE